MHNAGYDQGRIADAAANLKIRRALPADAGRIAELYNWYVLNTAITFDTVAVGAPEMRGHIEEILSTHDWLVAEQDSRLVGSAYYAPFRPRPAYGLTVATSIYLSRQDAGKGFGKLLYSALIQSAAHRGFREVLGLIALRNPASVALHRALGFQQVGTMRGIGYKFGKTIDVALWRSAAALWDVATPRQTIED